MKDRLIIFDIDGTITDTTAVDDLCFKKTFKILYNLDLENVDWTRYPHATDWGLAMGIIEENFNMKLSTNEKRKIEKHFIEILQEELTENPKSFEEIPGAVNFIKGLKKKDQPIAIATGAWKHSAILKLKKAKLEIKGIPFSNADMFYSREDILKSAIEQSEQIFDKKFKKIIYFGDGVWDYNTTKKLGIPLIGVDFHESGVLKKKGVKHIIKDYLNPEKVIEKISKM